MPELLERIKQLKDSGVDLSTLDEDTQKFVVPHLEDVMCRIQVVQEKAMEDMLLLERFPVAVKVERLELNPQNNIGVFGEGCFQLFGDQLRCSSTTNMVVLFDLNAASNLGDIQTPKTATNKGIVVTKSLMLPFSIVSIEGMKQYLRMRHLVKQLRGGIWIKFDDSKIELSLLIKPGIFKIKDYSINQNNSNLHYVPMWQRMQKII